MSNTTNFKRDEAIPYIASVYLQFSAKLKELYEEMVLRGTEYMKKDAVDLARRYPEFEASVLSPNFRTGIAQLDDDGLTEMYRQCQALAELYELSDSSAEARTGASEIKVIYQWPVTEGRINTVFGPTTPADTNSGKSNPQHNGIDIGPVTPGKAGQPITAMVGGKVVSAGNANDGYGNSVVIQQTDGYTSRYSHGTTVTVTKGQEVTAGSQLLTMGDSGKSGGVHVDIRIKDSSGTYIDPLTKLSNRPSTVTINSRYVKTNSVTGVLTNK